MYTIVCYVLRLVACRAERGFCRPLGASRFVRLVVGPLVKWYYRRLLFETTGWPRG